MNQLINVLADAVLSKKLDACSVEGLQDLSEKYPYSSALQLLYTQKLKEQNSDALNEQLQKTLLYYKNPLFIHYILNAETNKAQTSSNKTYDKEIAQELAAATPTAAIYTEEDAPAISEMVQEDEGEISIPELKIEPLDPATAQLAFTPYHTIDYFAAEGIKLNDEQNPIKDRFSTQLKSFTDWIKQMKRLPGSSYQTNITALEEKKIEKMAAQSVSGENAVTEAMAEVWIKQGNKEKAIEIYKKLSLQNPHKNAYFAAKIDYLKNLI
jgi:hypothetical protein